MHLEMSVSKILAHRRTWYFKTPKNFIEMTSHMIYIVALGGGLKCPLKIHLNTQPLKARLLSCIFQEQPVHSY